MTSPFQPGQNPGPASGNPRAGRGGPIGLPTPPKGWPIGSYPTYAEAQKAVDYLSDQQFPVQQVTIVGVDLMQVERVTGRLSWPKVLGGGVLTGAWLGIFVGLVLGFFGHPMQSLLTGLIAGIIFGLITSAIPYAMAKGTRDFSSTMQLVAGRYDVLCDPQNAEKARDMLARLTLWRRVAMAEIVLDQVSKNYPDGAVAVKDLSLTIGDGEFVILVGPSGCGKSTTLNMIAGLEDISSGELRIGGRRVNEKPPKDRDIAMVFQSYALYPHMTVRQNIAFPLTLAKMSKADIATKVEETAKVLDLTDFLDRKPSQLSGGQRQRVAMGRAIVRNPEAFLMDEPLSNLDAKLRVQMRGEIARLQQRLGTTTVYVTHDQTEAMTLGDRVVVLRTGVAQQIGTPEELYERPANIFVAGFIGSPAMNFFPATLDGGVVDLPFGEVALTQQMCDTIAMHATPRSVIVGVRPEHFEDAAVIDGYQRISSLTFPIRVELVESLGADKYVYFTAPGTGAQSEHLAELAAAAGVAGDQCVARVSPKSRAAVGQTMELALDTTKLVVFEADSGANLTVPPVVPD